MQWLRSLDVAQHLVADRSHPHAVWEVAGHDRARCLGQQHLPAAPDGGDARGTYDVEPGIALVTDGRLAGVQAEPQTDRYALRPRLVLVRALDLDSRRHRVARARKRVEEGVALRVDLLPVMRPERLAHDAPMGTEHLGVSSVTEALEQRGAALDVAEHERDGSRRKVRHDLVEDRASPVPSRRGYPVAISANWHRALARRICSGVRARTRMSAGSATTTATHRAREVATLRRFRE